jgi:rhamnogalacturonyl hydrolase YesR
MKKLWLPAGSIVFMLFLLGGCATTSKNKKQAAVISPLWLDKELTSAAIQYHTLMHNVPSGLMPESFIHDSLKTCTSKNWVSGFYPGSLLLLSEATKDTALYKEAINKIKLLEPEQYNTTTHDLGFMMYCSYGNLYRITHREKYKNILLNSARSLASRFNSRVGCIRSWGNRNDTSEFTVIIDNMMNLELLFWATKASGDSSFFKIAVSHADATMKNHFRPDFSSYHVVIYDPRTGKVLKKQTAQGAADSSAWARGQSWGLYGYTMMYRETKDKKYLRQAQQIAKFILQNPRLPKDKIPYWDYDAPGIPDTYRDASAGAILASALIELAAYSQPELSGEYLKTGAAILQTLSSPEYRARTGEEGGFLLKHSVANMNARSEVDAPQSYADYYYIEALMRFRRIRE